MTNTKQLQHLTYDEVDVYVQRGRELRAEMIRGFFRSLFSPAKPADKTAIAPRVLHGGA